MANRINSLFLKKKTMKKLILSFLLCFTILTIHSQPKDLKTSRVINFKTQNELFQDSTMNYFINKLNFNINDYQIVSLSRVVSISDSLTINKQPNLVRLIYIKYSTLDSPTIEYNRTKEVFDCNPKRSMIYKPKIKLMSAYKTIEADENGKYSVCFYSVEE